MTGQSVVRNTILAVFIFHDRIICCLGCRGHLVSSSYTLWALAIPVRIDIICHRRERLCMRFYCLCGRIWRLGWHQNIGRVIGVSEGCMKPFKIGDVCLVFFTRGHSECQFAEMIAMILYEPCRISSLKFWIFLGLSLSVVVQVLFCMRVLHRSTFSHCCSVYPDF